MPVFVTRELEIKSLNSIAYAKVLGDFKLIADTEFTQKDKMIVDGIGIYLPGLIDSGLLVFEYDELTPEFHPVKSCLEALGHSVQLADDESLGELLTNLAERFTEIVDTSQSPRLIKKDYLLALENGDFDDLLLEYGLDRSNLSYCRDSKAKESYPIIQPVKIKNEHEFFFAPADLFKIWGQEWQNILLNSDLMQFRSLRVGKPISQYFYIDEKLHELEITIRDSMYRFPPRKKSLDGQAKTFRLAKGKIDIVKKEFASEMNIPDENLIKENMSLFKKHFREIFFKYNAQDIFTSHELSETQQEFFNIILDSFNIPSIPVADTTGANVAKFIKETIFQHYNVSENDKTSKNLLKRAIQLTRIQNLQETPLNDFGIQPFLTVGGLLYTRMSRIPFIEGIFGDLDLQSCYATAMSNMSIYLGQPMVLTFKHKKYKP
ncbi:MAG TPA: hypothetical protein VK369_17570, partial [Segetibacter sp.]|nr:hypothetical protein [Segetibacter sp.]